MNCIDVRDRLTERALGGLPPGDGQAIDRHLAWCAACRKEAGELDRAAATLAFAPAPSDPARELQDRVVENVRETARKRRPVPHRGRSAVALSVAAMLAVTALGWGSVMAGRAARFAESAAQEKRKTQTAIARFSELISSSEFNNPENQVFLGTLAASTRGGAAGGSALTLVSPTASDIAIVMVNGLRPEGDGPLPFRVLLMSERGRTLQVGRIAALDSGGSATVLRRFDVDLSRYTGIEVRDRKGAIVLRGSVRLRTSTTTPSP